MKRSRALNAVCGHLRAGLLGTRAPGWHPWLAWESLIAVSSQHYVIPALAWSLRDNTFLPDQVRRHLDAVLILNGKRNEKLLKALARAAAALNAIDIEPVLLKGAAHLVEDVYPAPSLRMVSDLDLLVCEGRVKSAAEALQKIGFKAAGPLLPKDHHHWAVLVDPETGAGVELHMSALHRRSEHIIPVAKFHKNSQTMTFRGSQVRLPEPTLIVGHNIIHDALDHEGYLHRRVELRQLLDLAMIRTKHESAIDWTELDRRFAAADIGHVLAANLKQAEKLFGVPVPQIVRMTERPRRRRRRAECWTQIARAPALYVAARRRDPWGAFNLFKPKTWSERIYRIRAALRTGASY